MNPPLGSVMSPGDSIAPRNDWTTIDTTRNPPTISGAGTAGCPVRSSQTVMDRLIAQQAPLGAEISIDPLASSAGTAVCFRTSWRSKAAHDISTSLRQALQDQAELEQASNLLDSTTTAGLSCEERATRVDEARALLRNSTAGLSSFLRSMAAPKYYNERRVTTSDDSAERFFNLPEMTEMLLQYLHANDVLQMQRVNKSIKAIIEGSVKLQRQLGLAASPDSHFRLTLDSDHVPFHVLNAPESWTVTYHGEETWRGLSFSVTGGHFEPDTIYEADDRERTVYVDINLRVNGNGRLPRVGSRYRAMLLCQPVVKKMHVSTVCCRARNTRKINSRTGLTIGRLLDTAQSMISKHRLCPDADESMLDADGRVSVEVKFHGKVVLRADDPRLHKHSSRAGRKLHSPDHARKRHLEAYTRAKRVARYAGRPIPTLTEYEIELAEYEETL